MKTPEPWYQEGVVSNNVVDGVARRVGPDVAMEADCFVGGYPEGYYLPKSATQASTTWYTRSFCGTSMASPMFAALEANVIQSRHGIPLGFLNPTLYGLYGSTGFHEVTDTPLGAGVTKAVVLPTASTTYLFSQGQCAAQNADSQPIPLVTPYCGTGFNQVTGLGSPAPALFGLLKQ
ncbi:hypothetical protein [Flexivirga caeni]|uniref:Peptidase S53 domain-containing protein n=1 Tax=Flexivirga caeni TaxID=2294115 RepID=A0A3M9MJ55_9MICO|nr:hypothetical protein [Flexivirga caeni]RNI24883.1 hypothetical protein EFY87_04155 [Flexivirga caeni]